MAVDYDTLRDSALSDLKKYMDSLDQARGIKLAYWIKDYSRFLSQETTFDSSKLIRYKRGAIVKVHLGYRVGSEEGGLHYAIVMDRDNSIYSPTLTVIPLTSVKPGVDLTNLPQHKLSIGDEVFMLLMANINAELRAAKQMLKEQQDLLDSSEGDSLSPEQRNIFNARMKDFYSRIDHYNKLKRETSRMKIGSIALVGQITTISKIRIYDPKYPTDALSNIRVSSATLDRLDARVQELYAAPRHD